MKVSSCLLGFGFLGASFWTSLAQQDREKFEKFESTLSKDQREIYYKIKRERLHLYLTGLAIGTALALGFLYMNPMKNLLATICIVMAIAWGFTYLYYTLMPKSTFMLEHLTNEDQVDAWVDVYRDMQVRYVGGFALGVVAYGLLCHGFFNCGGNEYRFDAPITERVSF